MESRNLIRILFIVGWLGLGITIYMLLPSLGI